MFSFGNQSASLAVVFVLKLVDTVLNGWWTLRNLRMSSAAPPKGTATWIEFTGAPISESEVIVWLPGGAFCFHDPFEVNVARALLPRLAAERGSAPPMLVFHYDLPATFAGTPSDLDDILRWLRMTCGVDRIVLAGDSAGAFLVVNHLIEAYAHGRGQPVDAALALYPLLDMTCSGASHIENAHLDAMHISMIDAARRSFTPKLSTAELRDASPAFAPAEHLHAIMGAGSTAAPPPVVIVSGRRDLLRSDASRFCEASRRAYERNPGATLRLPEHVEVDDGIFGIHCAALFPQLIVGRSEAIAEALEACYRGCKEGLEDKRGGWSPASLG